MILIKCDRHGNVYDLEQDKDYTYLVDLVEEMTEELESNGVMLVNTTITDGMSRVDEFASIENGWECAIVIAHSRAKSVL